MLDSNGIGLAQGLKFSLKSVLSFTNLNGGTTKIYFRMKNFHEKEFFRVLINGVL